MDYPHSLPDVYLYLGKYTDGTSDGSIPPSRDPARWNNDVTDELLAVIVAGGLTPDEANLHQVRDAIAAMIAAALPSLWGYVLASAVGDLAYLDAGQGIEADGAGGARVKLDGATLARSASGVKVNLGNANIWTAPQTPGSQDLVDDATVAIAITAQVWTLTTAAARTMGAPTGGEAKTTYRLELTSGGHSPAWNAVYKFPGGTIPSSLTGLCIFDFYFDGTNYNCVGQNVGEA